jgi:hypothetical protein
MAGNVEQLLGALQNTLSPNALLRADAERFLSAASKERGFLPVLLQAVVRDGLDGNVQLAAAVQLKNFVKLNWARNEEEMQLAEGRYAHVALASARYFGSAQKVVLDEADKAVVRANLVEAVARSQHKATRKTLGAVVYHIGKEDYPSHWSGVVGEALKLIVTQDPGRMHAGLVVLNKVIKPLTYNTNDDDGKDKRAPLNDLVGATFPMLRELFQALLAQNVEDLFAAELIKLLCKVFFKSFAYGLPPLLLEEEQLRAWAQLCVGVVLRPLSDDSQPASEEARLQWPWWKAKWRAAMVLERMVGRYGFPWLIQEADRPACAHVTRPGGIAAELALPTAMRVLKERFVDGRFYSGAVVSFMLNILEDACEYGHLFQLLKPELPALVHRVLLPVLRMTDKQLAEWTSDPQQLVADLYSFENLMGAHKGMSVVDDALYLMEWLCRTRKRYALPLTMEAVGRICQAHAESPRDAGLAMEKSAALQALGALAHLLRRDPAFNAEELAARYVVPDLDSSFGFLRFHAARCLSLFLRTKWSSLEAERAVATGMLRMLGDRELPVKVEAARCVASLLEHASPSMQGVVQAVIPDVVRSLLALTREVQVDHVFQALRMLIAHHPGHVLPFGVELCRSIAEAFFRLATEEGLGEGDDDLDLASSAYDCLDSLDTLLSAFSLEENNAEGELGRQVLVQVTPIVLPLLDLILAHAATSEEGEQEGAPDAGAARLAVAAIYSGGAPPQVFLDMVDFTSQALHMLHNLTWNIKAVAPQMWRYPALMSRITRLHGGDNTLEVLSCLETMIHYDPAGFLWQAVPGLVNAEIVLEVFSHAVEGSILERAQRAEAEEEGEDGDDEGEDEGEEDDDEGGDEMDGEEEGEMDDEGDDEYDEYNDLAKAGAHAAYMVSTMLQVCAGQLDAYVKPIVDLMLKACEAPMQEPWVVINFLNTVQSCIYYNAEKALQAIGKDRLAHVFKLFFEFNDSNLVVSEKMVALIAFTRVLAISPAKLPKDINKLRPKMLKCVANLHKGLLKLRKAIAEEKAAREKARQEAAAKGAPTGRKLLNMGADGVDRDDECLAEKRREGPTDVPEDADVHAFKEQQAAGAVRKMADMTQQERMQQLAAENDLDEEDEEDEEDDDVTSPLDDLDECVELFLTFAQAPPDARAEMEQIFKRLKGKDVDTVGKVVRKMLAEGQQRSAAR